MKTLERIAELQNKLSISTAAATYLDDKNEMFRFATNRYIREYRKKCARLEGKKRFENTIVFIKIFFQSKNRIPEFEKIVAIHFKRGVTNEVHYNTLSFQLADYTAYEYAKNCCKEMWGKRYDKKLEDEIEMAQTHLSEI